MLEEYFTKEKEILSKLGEDFSNAHRHLNYQKIANDPDVKCLLDGVALLTGVLKNKLDDDFPEIIEELIRLILPHYLRPIPSLTIVAFEPKAFLKDTNTINSKILLESQEITLKPEKKIKCSFRTCYEVEIHPLILIDVKYEEPAGKAPVIKLKFEFKGHSLQSWDPTKVRLFFMGRSGKEYSEAADIYLTLRNYTKNIKVRNESGGKECNLELRPVGFDEDEIIINYPSNSFIAYRIIQEYFALPEKFLFLDIEGWNKWEEKGESSNFEIDVELKEKPHFFQNIKNINKENIILYATPATNIFSGDIRSIIIDQKKYEYPIEPEDSDSTQLYFVEKITGLKSGQEYVTFDSFVKGSQNSPVYSITTKLKESKRNKLQTYLSVNYPNNAEIKEDKLSIKALCTNGSLPYKYLQDQGAISKTTKDIPNYASYKNITSPTQYLPPPLGKKGQWNLLSHLTLNYLSISNKNNLKQLLNVYIFGENEKNRNRVNGITDLEHEVIDKLVDGIMLRGSKLTLKVNSENFACQGDLYLFGCVMDYFFKAYASINSFFELRVEDITNTDRYYSWDVNSGNRFLT